MQRYFTKLALIETNEEAVATNRNRTLVRETLLRVSNHDVYPGSNAFAPTGVEVRCAIEIDETGMVACIDVSLQIFAPLPHDPRVAEDGYDAASTDTLTEELTQRYETAVQ